jgi:hypothetical protein
MKRFSFELPSLATMSRFFSDTYTNDASVSLKGLIEHLRERADALEELSYPEDDETKDKPDDEIEEETLSVFADGDDIFLEAQMDSDQSGFWQGLLDNGIVEEIIDADDADYDDGSEDTDDALIVYSGKGYATGETTPAEASIEIQPSGLVNAPFEVLFNVKNKSSVVLDQAQMVQLRDALNEAIRTF